MAERGALLNSLDKIIAYNQTEQRLKASGQTSMFGDLLKSDSLLMIEETQEVPVVQKFKWERELMGISFSSQILNTLRFSHSSLNTVSCGEITMEMINKTITTIGMVTAIRQGYTRDNRPFLTVTVEDAEGHIEVNVWPKTYEKSKELWEIDNIIIMKGTVKPRNGGVQLNCHEVNTYTKGYQKEIPLTEPSQRKSLSLVIRMFESDNSNSDINLLQQVYTTLYRHPGNDTVSLEITSQGIPVVLDLYGTRVNYCQDLVEEINGLLGEGMLQLN